MSEAQARRAPVVSTLLAVDMVVGTSYQVAIRDNLTRRVAVVTFGEPWGPDSLELWTKGEMACDCARHELYEEEDEAAMHYPAHGQGRYTALWAELADGRRIGLEEPLPLH